MSSIWGKTLKLSVWGESHGAAVGGVVDGFPAGLEVDMDCVLAQLKRRSASSYRSATTRIEADIPTVLSGLYNGKTTGTPISFVFENSNVRRGDYNCDTPRPGHGDYTAHLRYSGCADLSGGGHMSGRLTLPMVFAGALAKQYLSKMGITVAARLSQVGDICDSIIDPALPYNGWQDIALSNTLPMVSGVSATKADTVLAQVKGAGNSISGSVQCFIYGVKAGVGSPIFNNIESLISSFIFAIPGVKGIYFGDDTLCQLGSSYNDSFTITPSGVATDTNHCGGILGGITNGMPIFFKVLFKPTPSISTPQQTISLVNNKSQALIINGRHDPCIAVRGVSVVEAAAALTMMNFLICGGTYEQD